MKPLFSEIYDLESLEKWEVSFHELREQLRTNIKVNPFDFQTAKNLYEQWKILYEESQGYQEGSAPINSIIYDESNDVALKGGYFMRNPEDNPGIVNNQKVKQLKNISANAYVRLLAMHEQENEAAEVMLTHRDAYPDFFLETGNAKFHEFVGPPEKKVEAENLLIRSTRMSLVDRLRISGMDKYADFFVDSPRNGPPWHEKFLDRGPKPKEWINDISERTLALSRLNVMKAYLKMLSGSKRNS